MRTIPAVIATVLITFIAQPWSAVAAEAVAADAAEVQAEAQADAAPPIAQPEATSSAQPPATQPTEAPATQPAELDIEAIAQAQADAAGEKAESNHEKAVTLQMPDQMVSAGALRPLDDSAGGPASPAPPTSGMFTPAVRWAQQRCVKIYGAGIAREHGYASGLIVSEDGLILTAFGLYVTGDRIRVVLPDGSIHLASVERRSDRLQSVLLRINAQTPDYFELVERPIVQPGDWVLAVGNPYKVADVGEDLSINLGVVSVRAQIDTKKRASDIDIESDVLLIDAITSNPGAPGGALITPQRVLAGMIGKIIESQSTNTRLNYAIPADMLRQFVDGTLEESVDEVEDAAGGRAVVGLRLFTLPGDRAAAYVDRVRRNSPAHRAGIRRDDLILMVNDQTVRSIRDYERIEQTMRPGRVVRMILKRGDEIIAVDMTPIAEPSDDQ